MDKDIDILAEEESYKVYPQHIMTKEGSIMWNNIEKYRKIWKAGYISGIQSKGLWTDADLKNAFIEGVNMVNINNNFWEDGLEGHSSYADKWLAKYKQSK